MIIYACHLLGKYKREKAKIKRRPLIITYVAKAGGTAACAAGDTGSFVNPGLPRRVSVATRSPEKKGMADDN